MEATHVSAQSRSDGQQQDYTFALIVLTSLFFMWGFLTVLNDVLIPHLKGVFNLSYTQAVLIQVCFFMAYFVCSMPSGALVKRFGYQRGIVVGLLIAATGCLLFLPAASFVSYPFFLGALFVLAAGITLLQVAANPYVTLLGDADSAPRRLNLTQAFNSLGTTVGPWIGGALILSAVAGNSVDSVRLPYTILAAALAGLAVLIACLRLPVIEQHKQDQTAGKGVLQYPHLVLGTVAIFVYVGAEVSIGSFMINFMGERSIAGLEELEASKYVSYYWGGAMLGRFVGVALMFFIKPNIMLSVNAIAAVLLLLVAVFSSGAVAMWALIGVGLCNSLMFPTIFSLAISRLGPLASKGSGVLCMAIVGGALVPLAQGVLADNFGLQLSFLLPAVCYVYILFYGVSGYRPRGPLF